MEIRKKGVIYSIYIYITETFETFTIFHVNIIFFFNSDFFFLKLDNTAHLGLLP